MNIKELKARRDELWSALNAIMVEKAPIQERESKIRSEIKSIQEDLYRQEMLPVMHDIEKKLSEGSIADNKIEAFEAKLKVLKEKFA